MSILLLHGGAGRFNKPNSEKDHRQGIGEALEKGMSAYSEGKGACDAVERAIMNMEDNPTFNCGYGSVLDHHGRVQMDAALMTSELEAGGIVNATGVKHPISVARQVMEETDHMLLGEPGLAEFLNVRGIRCDHDMVAPLRREEWESTLRRMNTDDFTHYDKNLQYLPKEEKDAYYSTVGAVGIDDEGLIVAGTSTGGIRMKMFGRIGDTPLYGCGTYADGYGAASATGIGEQIIKMTLCRMVVLYMRDLSAQDAVDKAMKEAKSLGYECGVIGVDRKGNTGYGYTTECMSWAVYGIDGKTEVF